MSLGSMTHAFNIKKAKDLVAVKHGYDDGEDYKFWDDLVNNDQSVTDEICVEYAKLSAIDFIQSLRDYVKESKSSIETDERSPEELVRAFMLAQMTPEQYLGFNGWREYQKDMWLKREWFHKLTPYEKMAKTLEEAYEMCKKETKI
jgi:hypothetical protein